VLIIRRSNCIIQHLVSSHSGSGRPVRRFAHRTATYVVGKLSSRTRHCVLAVAALDRSLDDDDISALHSCAVVDLWQSLSEWHLLMSACVLVCRREKVGA
jgi:hypothetical protein